MPERAPPSDSKKKKRRRRRQFTFENILGGISRWILAIIAGGLMLFLGSNVYMVQKLWHSTNDSQQPLPVVFLQRMWDNARENMHHKANIASRRCPHYGCPITPPEYTDAKVTQALKTINTTSVPFGSWKMATLTRTSNRKHPPFNQDAAVIIQPYRPTQTTHDTDFFLGIFDGHGEDGHINAHYFAKDVPARLAEKLDKHFPLPATFKLSEEDIQKIVQHLKDTFVQADDQAPKNITLRGGCTGSVTLRMGNHLFFANAGDSYTMLVSVNAKEFQIKEAGPGPGVQMIYTTRGDKPHLPEENARILAAGGKVHIPPQNPMLSRVIVHSDVFNDTIGLAMSRSLGDYEWTVKGVIPEPLVDVIHLDELVEMHDESTSIFVIAASDGMWDYRLKQWYAKQFAESFLKGKDPRKLHPLTKMKNIIDFVSPKNEAWYRDDITAITMKVT